jgi:outer membrane protein assembly factor BamB
MDQWKNPSENKTSLEQEPTFNNRLVSDPTEKIPIWQFDYRDNYGYANEPIVADNKVFFVAEGLIYCLDASNGTLICKYDAPINMNPYNLSNQYSYHLVGIYNNSLVVVNNTDIYCIDSEKGNTLWYLLGASNYILHGDKLYFYENKLSIYNNELWDKGSFRKNIYGTSLQK